MSATPSTGAQTLGTGKVAVVTGAAGGIGRALTRHLAADGYVVHAADIVAVPDPEAHGSVRPHHLDVTDPRATEALASMVGHVDALCLNAGVVGPTMGPPWEASPDEWDTVLGVNLVGVVNGLRAFVPRLLDADRPARILITASLAGLLSFPGGGAYAASKHALVTVAEQTALALEGTPVSVTVLCPALVRTGMSAVGADPSEVAAEALTAAASGRFLVLPDEWRSAIHARAHRLASGAPPQRPTATTGDQS